jgi:hypothetical protein
MFDLGTTKYNNTVERPLAPGAEITAEGQLLKSVLVGGVENLKPTEGGSNAEVLVGFASNSSIIPDQEVVIEDTLTVPAAGPFTIQLKNVNLVDGSLYVYDVTTGSAIVKNADATLATGEYDVNLLTGLLTFNAAQSGNKLIVTYRYNMTKIQVQQKYWGRQVNAPDPNFFGNAVAMCGSGEIYTDQFDTSVSFEGVSKVYAGAGGRITSVAGSNTLIPARITKLPTAASPTLGLAFNFA